MQCDLKPCVTASTNGRASRAPRKHARKLFAAANTTAKLQYAKKWVCFTCFGEFYTPSLNIASRIANNVFGHDLHMNQHLVWYTHHNNIVSVACHHRLGWKNQEQVAENTSPI